MKLFFKFLGLKKNIIILYLIFSCIFIVTFALYRLPFGAVVYPLMLCGLLGAAALIAEFLKFRKKHSVLEDIKKMNSEMITTLPECDAVYESDYQEIIEALRSETIALEDASITKYRDMTEYYSVWAHQIKTPIASMKLTLQGEDSPAARKLMSELLRIEQYVEMVLAFIRLDSTSTDYVFREYSVDDIVKQSVRRFAPDFIGKKIRLEYDSIDEKIITDEKWFAFVIEQILSNALKYTKEGSVKIYKTQDLLLCIEDTGIGISPDDLPRIFEKGYTGFNGRTDKTASGIGLYLCRRICDNLKKIKCPAAVVGAAGDKVFSIDDFRLIAEAIGCEMYIYENYSHAVYDEAPDFKERIASFFAD